MDIEWLAQDLQTLAHTSKVRIGGKSAVTPHAAQIASPHRATTSSEASHAPKSALVVAGEPLGKQTLESVGHSKSATDALMARLKAKMIPDRINLVYTRIPSGYLLESGARVAAPRIDDLRASALVDVQLEADASLVIPPLPTEIDDLGLFEMSLKRTTVSIQTFNSKKEILGLIPKTDHLELVRDMVAAYVKAGAQFFAVDFSGASNQPSLMRTVVKTIRETMKIKKRAGERQEKYYLHAFDVGTAKKSTNEITPITDIITHPYGVDSTSGVMWGGGKMDVSKLRYYNTSDYGHYRRAAILKRGTTCNCKICSTFSISDMYNGTPVTVYNRLKAHRVAAYADECVRVSERIAANQSAKSYWPYLTTKDQASQEIDRVLHDVMEVQAML